MSAGERNCAVVTLAAGDSLAAMRQLLRLVATKHIPLRPHLVQLCTLWLDGYVFHEEYVHLRGLMEGVLMPQAIQAFFVMRGRSTKPGHGAFVHRYARRTTASGSIEKPAVAPASTTRARLSSDATSRWMTPGINQYD